MIELSNTAAFHCQHPTKGVFGRKRAAARGGGSVIVQSMSGDLQIRYLQLRLVSIDMPICIFGEALAQLDIERLRFQLRSRPHASHCKRQHTGECKYLLMGMGVYFMKIVLNLHVTVCLFPLDCLIFILLGKVLLYLRLIFIPARDSVHVVLCFRALHSHNLASKISDISGIMPRSFFLLQMAKYIFAR